jgi:hypothetical protein
LLVKNSLKNKVNPYLLHKVFVTLQLVLSVKKGYSK